MKTKWTFEVFKKWLEENEPNYRLLDIYTKNNTKFIKVLCENNHEYNCRIQHFVRRGYRCKECYYNSRGIKKLNNEELVEIFKENGFLIIEDIESINVDRMYLCKDSDGYIVKTSITNIRANKTPVKWHKSNPYSIYNISNYLKIFRSDYIILSDVYSGSENKYKFKYIGLEFNIPDELREFECSWNKFLNRRKENPHITASKIEKIFELILLELGLKYKKEYTFDDLKDKAKLRYDFAVFNSDNKLLKIYELHGKQHYEHYPLFGDYDYFLKRKEIDKKKEIYCKNNNIKLEVIKYDYFNKEENIQKLKYEIAKEVI